MRLREECAFREECALRENSKCLSWHLRVLNVCVDNLNVFIIRVLLFGK